MFGIACTVDSTFCIFSYLFLKDVCFALEGDHIHPWKRIGDVVDSRLFELM